MKARNWVLFFSWLQSFHCQTLLPSFTPGKMWNFKKLLNWLFSPPKKEKGHLFNATYMPTTSFFTHLALEWSWLKQSQRYQASGEKPERTINTADTVIPNFTNLRKGLPMWGFRELAGWCPGLCYFGHSCQHRWWREVTLKSSRAQLPIPHAFSVSQGKQLSDAFPVS